jgi:putative transposase
MAKSAVGKHGISIRLSCAVYGISQTRYRYNARPSDENGHVADWLLRLTQAHKRWGFGLCFLHLRNVKSFRSNHKRIYRIYRELALNLRIKPRRRNTRAYPGELNVTREPN